MIPASSSSWGRKGESRCGVFPLSEISLHTHALPTNVYVRGQDGEATFYPNVILVFSRARRCAWISFWMSFDYRTDFAYCALSGFDRFEPLDCFQKHVGIRGSWSEPRMFRFNNSKFLVCNNCPSVSDPIVLSGSHLQDVFPKPVVGLVLRTSTGNLGRLGLYLETGAPTARTQQAGLSQGQATWDYL
ncbi:unnamed protein product [Prunus armeniaca]